MEDRELIRQIQNGKKEYLDDIARKYYDDIYYFCCYQTGSREDAYDLTQETFLRFIRYVDRYRYRNLKGYLLTIAMNLCREYLREHHKEEKWGLPEEAIERMPEAAESTVGADNKGMPDAERTERGILLFTALLALPEAQREAVLLHHFYGYKNREIARMTGSSFAAVKSRIRQGVAKLARLLDKDDFYV